MARFTLSLVAILFAGTAFADTKTVATPGTAEATITLDSDGKYTYDLPNGMTGGS